MRILAGFLLLLISYNLGIAQSTGLPFLKIGVGGRATGMAEAFTAIAADATATYWNPAGLRFAKQNQLSFTHNEWLQEVRSEFVAFVLPRTSQTLGFSLNSTNIGDIPLRGEQPTEEPLATFGSHDLALGFSYARSLTSQIDLGLTAKYLYEKIYIEETSGFAFDLGANYSLPALPLRAAFVLQNIGTMNKFKSTSPSLPSTLRFGLAYLPNGEMLHGSWLVAADVVADFKSNQHINVGVEYLFQQVLALRLGYQSGYDIKNLHFGFGLLTGRLSFDYGYVPLKRDFGQGHRLTLGVLL